MALLGPAVHLDIVLQSFSKTLKGPNGIPFRREVTPMCALLLSLTTLRNLTRFVSSSSASSVNRFCKQSLKPVGTGFEHMSWYVIKETCSV